MKIVLYDSNLFEAGGEERLLLEHARYLKRQGNNVWILTLIFHPNALFEKYHDIPIITFSDHQKPRKINMLEKIKLIFNIRKKLWELKPDLIIGQMVADCGILYIATLFSKIKYLTHIHGTIMWFPDENTKYSFLHLNVMRQLRKRVIGHQQFYPEARKASTWASAFKREVNAWIRYLGIRKAETVFTLSELMAAEILCLYGKKAVVLKGAYKPCIFDRVANYSIKADLGLADKKIILNINRLDARKRIDMLIKAFSLAEKRLKDAYLVIGGTGKEEENLKDLVRELGLDRIVFLGFVPEEKLLDYYATCDLFVHPNWADYAITVYEALAMGKKTLCTTEMEFDRTLLEYSQIFTAEPYPETFAQVLIQALECPNDNPIPNDLLRNYSWDNYFKQVELHFNIKR